MIKLSILINISTSELNCGVVKYILTLFNLNEAEVLFFAAEHFLTDKIWILEFGNKILKLRTSHFTVRTQYGTSSEVLCNQ